MSGLLTTELAWAIRRFEFDLLLDPDLLTLQRPFSQNDAFKLDVLLEDLLAYLPQLKHCLHQSQSGRDKVEWYVGGRATLVQVLEIQGSIDLFLSSILLVPLVLSDGVFTAKLKRVYLVLLECKLALLNMKKKIDIVSNYEEIKGQIIDGLLKEVRQCAELFEECKLRAVLSETPIDISLEQIIAKMKLGDVAHSSTFSVRSLAYPAISEAEKETDSQLESLKQRLDPIHVAMDFLDQRVQNFNSTCGTIFPGAIVELNLDYDRLRKLWDRLLTDYGTFKKHTVDSRWHSLFLFLIQEILNKSLKMIKELESHQSSGSFYISDALGSSFKICSNAITLIHKAFMENVIYDKELVSKYNDTLLTQWSEVNALLSNDFTAKSESSPLPTPSQDKGYRPLKMAQGRTPLAESKPERPIPTATIGMGIDLGLGVNPSPSVPFSITKSDRIVDLSIDTDIMPKSSIQKALMGLADPHGVCEDDDIATLVHNTPVISQDKPNRQIWAKLQQTTTQKSRIPLMAADYSQRGYPVIKKKVFNGGGTTKIPSISPLNAVFISPDRRSQVYEHPLQMHFETPVAFTGPESSAFSTLESAQTALRSPPVFNLSRTHRQTRRVSSSDGSVSGEDIFRSSRSRLSSLRVQADKMSLVGMTTPNLAFEAGNFSDFSPDRVSLRSTSPERPESSIGSRFDDLHLTQPLKSAKKMWR